MNNEADASADQTDTKQDETKADDTAQKNDEAAQKTDNAATQAGNAAQPVVDGADVTVAGTSITIPAIKFQGANAAVAEALTKDVKIDENDPAIKGLRKELENLEIVGGEEGIENDDKAIATCAEEEKKNGLSEEQIQTVLGLYQDYQEYWTKHADLLGVQTPFFLDFNDSKDDKLGVLGEMLALAGQSVDDVRNGTVSYDDLTGTILTFKYGDEKGVEYYDKKSSRQEKMHCRLLKIQKLKQMLRSFLY